MYRRAKMILLKELFKLEQSKVEAKDAGKVDQSLDPRLSVFSSDRRCRKCLKTLRSLTGPWTSSAPR